VIKRLEERGQSTESGKENRYAADTDHGAPVAQDSVVGGANHSGGWPAARARGGVSRILRKRPKRKGSAKGAICECGIAYELAAGVFWVGVFGVFAEVKQELSLLDWTVI
jgi:hypothetical protein